MEEQNKYISDLLIRYVNGLYTRNDIETLRKLASSITERAKLESEMDRVWNEAQDLPQSDSHNHLLYKKEAQDLLDKTRKRERRISLSTFIKYAASIAIIVSIGFGAKLYLNHSAKQHTSASDHLLTEISVNHGEHKQVTLPDGTVVHLNAGTVMRYPTEFTSDIRLVEMEGEAFFNVMRDEGKPFIVRTRQADVKVLGTSFNVKAYQEDELMAVSVRTGKVEVDMPESVMRLLPNEQIIVNNTNGEILKKNEDAQKVTAWLQGGLYFNRTPISSVIHDLERMYNQEIVLDPNVVFDDYIYGEHDNKSLEAVLNAIQYSTGIRYRKEESRIVLYKTSH